MTAEQEFEREQRPFRIRKSLRELVHKPHISRTPRYSVTLPPLPAHDSKVEEYAYDVLYECQRGSLAVGYSSKTLMQFDPNPWCDSNMRFTPMNIGNYQLPDPTWQWVSKDWMIDMTEDVDEAGWQYALKFHGAVWHGNYKHFRSFVRRRRWIRLRHRYIKSNHTLASNITSTVKTRTLVDVEDTPSNTCSVPFDHKEIMNKLQKSRLDRERLSILNHAIKSVIPGLEDQLLQRATEYISLFDYDESKLKFLSQLLIKKYGTSENKITLNKQEKEAIQSLRFYCDIQSTLNRIDPTATERESQQ